MRLERNGSRRTAYLALDQLATQPDLARRLPFDLAQRYHALPLAEEGGRVTVALGNPDDEQARAAILAALGPESCVVRGDPHTIDERLAEVWADAAREQTRLRVCVFLESTSNAVLHYARALGALLGASLECIEPAEYADARAGERMWADYALAIVSRSNQPLMRRLLSRTVPDSNTAARQDGGCFSVLAVQEPRWPLRRILLVLCGQDADNLALDWVLRLACPSGAAVTALAVLPPVPAMYRGLASMEQSLASVLATDTPLGCQMRQVAKRLVERKTEGTLCLRDGAPDQQICREIVRGDYDLVVVATKSCRWWLRQLRGVSISALQNRVSRPVLFVEPTIA